MFTETIVTIYDALLRLSNHEMIFRFQLIVQIVPESLTHLYIEEGDKLKS